MFIKNPRDSITISIQYDFDTYHKTENYIEMMRYL